MKNITDKYKKQDSEPKLWKKIKGYGRKAGIKVVYTALLLFYAYKRKDTPQWAKNIVIGALGYFVSPIDIIPDLTPLLGYTDDIGVLTFGLITIAAYVNVDVKMQAKDKLGAWFGEYDEAEIIDIDDKVGGEETKLDVDKDEH